MSMKVEKKRRKWIEFLHNKSLLLKDNKNEN